MFFGGAPRVLNMPSESLRFSIEAAFLRGSISDKMGDWGSKGNDEGVEVDRWFL